MADVKLRRTRLAEVRVDGQRLGRHIAHDPRSRDYQAEAAAALKSVKHAATGLPLDQGNIGSCTANALVGALNSAPNLKGKTPLVEADAQDLYHAETVVEGEPWPPNDPGGTGLYVCRVGKAAGFLSSYRHAFGIDHALHALVLRPVITGVNWYQGFDQPNANGYVQISGQVRGGHEVVVDEIDVDRRLVWMWNSWGPGYGLGGRFCWSFDTWDELLQEQGDVTVPYAKR